MHPREELGRRQSAVSARPSVAIFTRGRQAAYRAKAKIMRLLVVITLNVANSRQTRGSLDRTH